MLRLGSPLVSFAEAFAGIAAAFDVYQPATARWQGEAVTDTGGSIVTPATPVEYACQVQLDTATMAMRQADGFTENDMRLLVLNFDRDLDTDAEIEILSGIHAGLWSVESATRDPAGIGWEARGRRISE